MSYRTLEEVPGGPASAGAHATAHLLVVDDDPHILKLCRVYLGDASFLRGCVPPVVHTASSGEEALDIAERLAAEGEPLACALVDVLMPDGIDGIDTIDGLWRVDATTQCTLVTGATERVEKTIRERIPVERLDGWDYLAKPFTRFELVQRVRRALSYWHAHRNEERRDRENRKLLARLESANRELEAKVADRTRDLAARGDEQERKNLALEKAMRDLEAAQGKLLQREKMACIGQLAAGVAHELNNPIGYVHSNLGTLRRYFERIQELIAAYQARVPDDVALDELKTRLKVGFVLEDLPGLIEESLEGTERVRKIVSDLKVFSHPAEHEAKFADLNAGLRSTLNIVRNEIKYKARVETDFGDLPEVRCLPGQINQVFMNLLINASQAIGESGEIRVVTERDGDQVVVTIADDGCGIPADQVGRIFDPFFTTKEVGTGTGLGLSISYDIVRKHRGTLSVTSRQDEGTTFVIRLPVDGFGDSGDTDEQGNAG